MLTVQKQQLIKFIALCLLSVAGLSLYIVLNGSFVKALVIYLIFSALTKVSNIAYHRWLAHRHFEVGTFGTSVLLYSMVASGLVRPLDYLLAHRAHHRYSDTDNDPHPPKIGFWKALTADFNSVPVGGISIKDAVRNPMIMFVHKNYYQLVVLHLILLLAIDIDVFLLSFAFLNLRYYFNATLLNYIAHGGRHVNEPQNLSWAACWLLGFLGEQLHKNHHDRPSDANFGKISLLNFDVGYVILKHVARVKMRV